MMNLIKNAIEIFQSKDAKDADWNAYWKPTRKENCFRRCRPEQLILDGYYAKLLKAFADLFGLEHEVAWSKTTFGLGLELSVSIKNKWYHSALNVFEEGQIAYVSSMRKYTQDANPNTIEEFSKKIVLGTFGEKRYIKSMKGGDCDMYVGNGQFEPVPRFEIYNLPRNEEELLIRLNLEGIDPSKCRISLERSKDYRQDLEWRN